MPLHRMVLALCALSSIVASGPALASTPDWLVGSWCQSTGGRLLEEQWLPFRGEMSIGMSRSSRDGVVRAYEFMRLERQASGWILYAQPSGQSPTEFAESAQGENFLHFANPKHDAPTAIEYRREGETLRATLVVPQDGQDRRIEIVYGACVGGEW